MPVELLTDEQAAKYAAYDGAPSRRELERFFFLDGADRALNEPERRAHNRLGFAVQMTTVRFLGVFLDDPADEPGYRRQIKSRANLQEGRHSPARKIFHGRSGQLYQRYQDGMEDQIGALGLVLNALVLSNTRYMDAAVNQLRADGFDVRDEDVARLSPFVRHHVNMLGRYSFQLPDLPGGPRPRRDPDATDEECPGPAPPDGRTLELRPGGTSGGAHNEISDRAWNSPARSPGVGDMGLRRWPQAVGAVLRAGVARQGCRVDGVLVDCAFCSRLVVADQLASSFRPSSAAVLGGAL